MSCNRATYLTNYSAQYNHVSKKDPRKITVPDFLPFISLTFENAYLRKGNMQSLIAIPRSYSRAIHHDPTTLQPSCFSLNVQFPFKIFFRQEKESISMTLRGYLLYKTSGHPSAQPLICQVLQSLGSYWPSKLIVLQAALNEQRWSSLCISVGIC